MKYKKVVIKHPRGHFENMGTDFYRIYFSASPEDYDYSNWTLSDLQKLQDALNEFIAEIKTEHIII
jgi:hypothetical protein